MKRSRLIKDLAISLSLANLCFIKTWDELLDSAWAEYFVVQNFNRLLSVIINVMGLAVLFWIAASLVRVSRSAFLLRFAQSVFLMLALIPLQWILLFLLALPLAVIPWKSAEPSFALRFLAFSMAVIVTTVTVLVIRRWRCALIRPAGAIVLVLFPFCLVTTFQASQSMRRFSHKALAQPLNERRRSDTRVLWLLFDEMDQRLAFSNRPETLQLPELDRLRSQAIFAMNAYAPADYTQMSIPALITGRFVSRAEPVNPSELMLTFAESDEPRRWSEQPNVFSDARASGFNTAVIGDYLPYCRVIGNSLTTCFWRDIGAVSLQESLLEEIQSFIRTIPLTSQLGTYGMRAKQEHARRASLAAYIAELEAAKKAAVDLELGLIFVHWPVPHPPGIYNRQKLDFDVEGESSYLDNLQLVDRTLGEIRQVMEETGTWDSTTVLVTSDHSLRPEVWRHSVYWTNEDEDSFLDNNDLRIPFLLKLAGQHQAINYNPEFNTVLTHDLLLSLLKGELFSGGKADSVVRWLDQHRPIRVSPYRLSK